MFGNRNSTALFDEFTQFLGEKVLLKGFQGFAGGLDKKFDSTGTHSLYTKVHGIEIMFHVSVLLPHFEHDAQQVEKKRHIGNDVVVVVFNESSTPFLPHAITSEYNHIYAVIQPLSQKSTNGLTQYSMAFASKRGTPPFGPLLQLPAVFEKNDAFKNFLLTKLLNAERAALEAPSFYSKLKRTRKLLLQEMAVNFLKQK